MQGIERIVHGEQLFAIIVRANVSSEQKYNFVTAPENSLQLGVNHYAEGEPIPAHYHLPVELQVKATQEFLILNAGRLRVTLFDPETQAELSVHELGPKDMVLLISGGHGFQALEPCQIVEVKQGPYNGKAKDKVVFGE